MNQLRTPLSGPCLGFFLLACSSTGEVKNELATSESDWMQAAPLLGQQIQDEAARLPWTHGFERLEQIRWFASIGEVAYPTLLDLAEDPRDDVAASALAALGATLDSRLVPHVHALDWSKERQSGDLGLERARTLVRLGDWSALPRLIDGLEDERLYTRSLCADALEEATHERFGFDPRADQRERAKSVARWREWWVQRSGEGILRR
jgi:HEAT repeat protein